MKKKGFTLIELLAVIVVLAIIALIAVPRILNVVDKAKISSERVSILGYIDAVEKQIIINQLDSNNSNDITTGVYTPDELKLKGVKVKGQTPSEGWVQIGTQKVEDYSLKSSTKSKIVINYDKTKKDAIVDFVGNIKDRPDGSSNAFTGTIYSLRGERTENIGGGIVTTQFSVGTSIAYSQPEKWCLTAIENGTIINSCDEANLSFDSEEDCKSFVDNDDNVPCERHGGIGVYETDASKLNSDIYYKYDVVNNLITESTICGIINGNEFCFDSSDSSPYTNNINILNAIFKDGTCERDSLNILTCSFQDITAGLLDDYGYAAISSDGLEIGLKLPGYHNPDA